MSQASNRLEVWDLYADAQGLGGSAFAWSLRPEREDWSESFLRKRREAAESGIRYGLRLEMPAHKNYRRTADGREVLTVRPPGKEPAWIDVVTANKGDEVSRIRLVRGPDGAIQRPQFEVRSADVTSQLRRAGMSSLLRNIERLLEHPGTEKFLGAGWQRTVERPGRAKRPDIFYAQKAQRYVEARDAEPATPIRWLIEQAEKKGRFETEPEWRAYLNRARERKLLTKAPPGKAGGHLTAKARKLLDL